MDLIRDHYGLTTVADVIEALGGNASVHAQFDRTHQDTTNWRATGFFPMKLYVAMTEALAQAGKPLANPKLWRMEPTKQKSTSKRSQDVGA
jgi:hypothetical protein